MVMKRNMLFGAKFATFVFGPAEPIMTWRRGVQCDFSDVMIYKLTNADGIFHHVDGALKLERPEEVIA